jgi:hypothetical protein
LVDSKDEFDYNPRKGQTSKIKFKKNKTSEKTTIETDEEGLVISIKPSNDIFQGAKLRRQASYKKQYYGDYIHLQNSALMKMITEKWGDQHVLFSASCKFII